MASREWIGQGTNLTHECVALEVADGFDVRETRAPGEEDPTVLLKYTRSGDEADATTYLKVARIVKGPQPDGAATDMRPNYGPPISLQTAVEGLPPEALLAAAEATGALAFHLMGLATPPPTITPPQEVIG